MNLDLILDIIRLKRGPLFAVGILLLVTVGLFSFRIFWQEPRLESLRSEWFEKRKLATGTAGRDPVTVFRRGTADLATFRERMPSEKEFVRILGDLYETSANNNLTVSEVTYKREDAKGKPFTPYTINVGAVGTYAGVKSFIGDLERYRELIVIDNVAFSAAKGDNEGKVDLKLSLTAYLKTEAQ